jgi:tRNA modification GTPase
MTNLAALLTPVGRGAVATIRVRGDLARLNQPPSLFHAANALPVSEQPIGRIAFGRWGQATSDQEEIVVCRSSDSVLEIHCHGGHAATQRILQDLNDAGFASTGWRELLTETSDLLDVELVEALGRATTWRTAEILNEQAGGLLRQDLESLGSLIDGRSPKALSRIDELLSWGSFGCHLSQSWNVVLTGRPNVGKSSLINALLGYQRAIVFDQPGTTRDVVTAETAFDGWPVTLADTAGLRNTSEDLEAAGIALAREKADAADARLVLVDLSQPPTDDDRDLLSRWPDAIVIGHKCDLGDCWGDELPWSALRVSSLTGLGLAEVPRRLVSMLVPHVPAMGTPIPVRPRQIDLLKSMRDALLQSDFASARQILNRLLRG